MIFRTVPIYKDYLWGGTKLKSKYNKRTSLAKVAESWELSMHAEDISTFSQQPKNLLQLYNADKSLFGTRINNYNDFPFLVKLIDAGDNLSLQVHPSDSYAHKHENTYGKSELWYVIDCCEGAGLYLGFSKNITDKELSSHLASNTLQEVLNFVPVRPYECYFIEAGTVHAIGKGVTICEIQQNSNLTYRLYDYGRRDSRGNYRELHLDKARQVVNRTKYVASSATSCEYFACELVSTCDKYIFSTDTESFACITFVRGKGSIDNHEFVMGDSFFVPASTMGVEIQGDCTFIITRMGDK